MLYRLYLYGTTAGTGKAPCLEDINHVLDTQSAKAWNNGNEPADFLAEFDVESVLSRIRNELGDKCKAHIDYPDKPANQVAYLFVGTSYQKVHEVLPRLYAIAAEYRLALYDAEKHKGYYKTPVDEALISMKLRAQAIKLRILDENEPVWEISQISSCCEEHQVKSSSFVVTLRKTADSSFQERTRRFYETLVKAIAQDEKLICENRCFTVEGSWYSITFCLEGYKKHPNMIGFYENGQPETALIRRMGCTEALRYLRKHNTAIELCGRKLRDYCDERMNLLEMVQRYPNPADRFVCCVNISKLLRKGPFDVNYGGIGPYGSEILFHIVPDEYCDDAKRISVLKIEEESASFILPFIADIYPFVYERYYLTENHVPSQMWVLFVKRILAAKEMILHDTFNLELKPYLERFNLHVLTHQSGSDYWEEGGDGYRIKNEPEQFLYEHRYDVAHLYDVFIQWSQMQLRYYDSDRMFNIEGP